VVWFLRMINANVDGFPVTQLQRERFWLVRVFPRE